MEEKRHQYPEEEVAGIDFRPSAESPAPKMPADLNLETLTSRLKNCLEDFNQKGTRPFRLSLSIGMARYSPDHPLLIDQLIAEADRAMVEQKRNKNAFPVQ